MEQKSKVPDFLTGTNFWISLLMLLLGPFGFKLGDAETTVSLGVGLVGFVGLVREFIKNFSFAGWRVIFEANGFQYFVGVLVSILPALASLTPQLEGLAKAILSGSLGSIISAVITLATMAYFLYTGKKKTA